MADPRNIAHDKKVHDEKKHHGEEIAPAGATVAPQPGKKTPIDDEGGPVEGHEAHHRSSPHFSDDDSGKPTV